MNRKHDGPTVSDAVLRQTIERRIDELKEEIADLNARRRRAKNLLRGLQSTAAAGAYWDAGPLSPEPARNIRAKVKFVKDGES